MRLFTGLSIGSDVLRNLESVLNELRPTAGIRWSPRENLHITTKFIGHWADEKLPLLQTALAEMEPRPSFRVEVSGFGYYPNPHRPTVLFAAVHENPSLTALAAGIDAALERIGCEPETRPYSPHITLARIGSHRGHNEHKDREEIIALREKIASMVNMNQSEFGSFVPAAFHLYLSQSSPGGSVYRILSSYPLAENTAAGPAA